MDSPSMGGDSYEEWPPLPPKPEGFDIPNNVDEFLAAIEADENAKAQQEREQADKLRAEVVQLTRGLQGILKGVDKRFGTDDETRMSYHSYELGDLQRDVLITTEKDRTLGDIWHIIVIGRSYVDGGVSMDYDEYALTKDMLFFNMQSGMVTTTLPEKWDRDILHDCALIHKMGLDFKLWRGNYNYQVHPKSLGQPEGVEELGAVRTELYFLTEVFENLSEGTHDERITKGEFF